jgi:hypothetical protein
VVLGFCVSLIVAMAGWWMFHASSSSALSCPIYSRDLEIFGLPIATQVDPRGCQKGWPWAICEGLIGPMDNFTSC